MLDRRHDCVAGMTAGVIERVGHLNTLEMMPEVEVKALSVQQQTSPAFSKEAPSAGNLRRLCVFAHGPPGSTFLLIKPIAKPDKVKV